jgi:hypothetical protein
MLRLSLEALAHAVAWILPPLSLVVDTDVESLVLDRHPEWGAAPNRRSE